MGILKVPLLGTEENLIGPGVKKVREKFDFSRGVSILYQIFD